MQRELSKLNKRRPVCSLRMLQASGEGSPMWLLSPLQWGEPSNWLGVSLFHFSVLLTGGTEPAEPKCVKVSESRKETWSKWGCGMGPRAGHQNLHPRARELAQRAENPLCAGMRPTGFPHPLPSTTGWLKHTRTDMSLLAGQMVQWGGHFPCTQPTRIQSLAPYMVP